MTSLVDILYILSSSLLIPVVTALLGFLMWTLMEIGGFVREARDRRRGSASNAIAFRTSRQKRTAPFDEVDETAAASFFERTDHPYPGLLTSFAVRGADLFRSERSLFKLVSDLEVEAAGRLARMNLGVRVGPLLGLMGTLIPMGPALIGLSNGNVDTMARNLVVAFSTTVLGLLVGGVCYTMLLVRRQWYAQDLSDIEYIASCLHDCPSESFSESGVPSHGSASPSTPREIVGVAPSH